jgi:hypothetical protein
MSITSYAELQAAVANWLARSDLAPYIPDFIMLFEAAANRRLRVRQMEAASDLAPSVGSAALPGDYLAWRRVTWTGANRVELAYVEPSYLQAAYPASPSATPRIFTIEGAALKIRPIDDTALELLYYQKIPLLSDAAPANWLLAAHPDLYLFGALAEAQMFAVDPDKAALWKARRDELFEEITQLSNKSRGAGSIRVMGVTP